MRRSWHGLLVVAVVAGCGRGSADAGTGADRAWPPLPRRVTVEVLNASRVDGLARDATLRLRRTGLDVVIFDNAATADVDTVRRSHRIFVRRGDTLGVGRVIEAIGTAEVVAVPDASRLVDLSVLLARDVPPPER